MSARDELAAEARAWADVAAVIRDFLNEETDATRPSFNATRLTHELRYSPQFARLIAAAEARGAERVRAAVEGLADEWERKAGGNVRIGLGAAAYDLRAALTAEPAASEPGAGEGVGA